jgi:hypothetical protein
MSAENTYKYEEFSINPINSGLNKIDISDNSVASFEYYEDILSPTVTAKINFAVVDIANLPGGFDIYGGEKFNIIVSIPGCVNKLNLSSGGKNLYVRKVSADKKSTSGLYSTEMVSGEVLTNEIVRTSSRYDGKVSDSANKIFSILQSPKSIDVESTANKYNFIGNTRRPFDLLIWLGPKSVPTGKNGFGSAGYLFFENQDGYKFKSIDKLITSESKFTYTQVESVKSLDNTNKFRIINSKISKNTDILNSLRMGMYSNISLFYNLYDNTTQVTEYKLSRKFQSMAKSTNSSQNPKLPKGIENSPSRYLTKTLDVGSFTKSGQIENIENLSKYQAEAAVRYNLLFSQVLNITIPCNLDLRAGQVITCNIPESTADSKNKTYESQYSGNYMIANLCHSFQGNQAYTYLSLIRDSYEIKTRNN